MFSSLVALCLAGFATAQNPFQVAAESGLSYSPARPPAVPLAVRSPYTSAWTSTSNNGTLNSNGVIFWTGAALGWEGIITVDGISYEYLGTGSQTLPTLPNLKTATPMHVSYDSQYSNFTFAAGPILLTASFLSPVLPLDYCRTSIPLSYLTTSFVSTDNATHSVQLYSDVNGAWISYDSTVNIEWMLYQGSTPYNSSTNATTTNSSSLYSWIFQLESQQEFGEDSDFPEWGNFSYNTSPGTAKSFGFQSGYSVNLLYEFVNNHSLADTVDPNYRPWGTMDPVFAFTHDFGSVSSGSVLYTLGSIQTPLISYLTTSGIQPLQPWWTRCYGTLFDMISFHYNDFATSQQGAYAWDTQLKSDVDSYYSAEGAMVYSNSTPSPPPVYSNGSEGFASGVDQFGHPYIFDPNTAYGFLNPDNFSGLAIPDVSEAESYYSIVALSARQVMGAYVLTVPAVETCGNSTTNQSEPLMFQKEISSDGNVNTVDVMFPAMPFFLYANPELLRFTLEPLYQNQESGFYPNGYSMHDLGSAFPNATGHVEGNDEYQPLEESGNMLIMTYAYYKFSGNSAFLQQHYRILTQWASYLIDFALIPNLQLSTDDFAGELINQTNLAIKGIVGLQTAGSIATVVGEAADATNYFTIASSYYDQWEYFGIDPSMNHTLLAYEWRSSWGLLYNIFPDKLLNLGLVSERVFEMQSEWYPQVSQVFGVPLDNRHSYTKSDWQLWTAAYCSPTTRRLFVNAIAYWLNNTSTNLAFSDLYETIDDGSYPVSPDTVTFIARPVVGGHYSFLSLLKAGDNSVTGTSLNSSFPSNSTSALSESGAAGSVYATNMPQATVSNFQMASMDHLSATVEPPMFTSVNTATGTPSNSEDSAARYTGGPFAKERRV
ncbi:MAG: hypothetical protein M1822_000084 [Bathelium mastoideum]|nr:MAG: hypothetical protein M1822_000084 [Bathelium mastoideum]